MKEVPKKIEQDFTQAYDDLADSLFRHSFFRVSKREVALDMVQETFLKTWKHIYQGGNVENLKPFLFKVMSNLIIDYYRKKKTSSLDALTEKDGFDPPDLSHEEINHNAEWSMARAVLDKLDENYKEIMLMRFVDNLSIGEIADILGESENVISVRLHRATVKAKKLFNNE